MRVIGGSAKGRRLHSPRGRDPRPTQDRVRESLFNLLASRLEGCAFLDLFAGSGAVGVEALSRGAARAVFVEKEARVCRVLGRNLEETGFLDRARVLQQPVTSALRRLLGEGERFDVVFLDPPYGEPELVEETLRQLGQPSPLLSPGGVVVVQMRAKEAVPAGEGQWLLTDERRFGDTALRFYRERTEGRE